MTSWKINCVAMCLWLAAAAVALAQGGTPLSSTTQASDAGTIHVYTNLLQIPVLILRAATCVSPRGRNVHAVRRPDYGGSFGAAWCVGRLSRSHAFVTGERADKIGL